MALQLALLGFSFWLELGKIDCLGLDLLFLNIVFRTVREDLA